MAHMRIGSSPRIEVQYITLFYLIKNFGRINGHSSSPTAECLIRYIRTHPESHIKEPHDKLVNAKIWGLVEERDGVIYLTNKAYEYLRQKNGYELTDLLNS